MPTTPPADGRVAEAAPGRREGDVPRAAAVPRDAVSADPPAEAVARTPREASAGESPDGAAPRIGTTAEEDGGRPGEASTVPAATAVTREGAPGATPGVAEERAGELRLTAEELLGLVAERARVHEGRDGTTTLHLTLEPEHLGRVRLELAWRDEGLDITFAVQRPEALAVLDGHLHRLEALLREQGLPVVSLQAALAGEGGWAARAGGRRADAGPRGSPAGQLRPATGDVRPPSALWAGLLDVLV